jgi:predicted metalloprotease with PDZ domain
MQLKSAECRVRGTTYPNDRFYAKQPKSLVVGGQRVANPIFSETKQNFLELRWLSRFNVVFDFPVGKMYLTKSRVFDQADGRGLSGMDIFRKDGALIIDSPDRDSAADKAGLRDGDEIVSIGELHADRSRLHEFVQNLAELGSVDITVRRDGKEFKTTLKLE